MPGPVNCRACRAFGQRLPYRRRLVERAASVWNFCFVREFDPFKNHVVALVDDECHDKRRNIALDHLRPCVPDAHPIVFDVRKPLGVQHQRINDRLQREINCSVAAQSLHAMRKIFAFNDLAHYSLCQRFSSASFNSLARWPRPRGSSER